MRRLIRTTLPFVVCVGLSLAVLAPEAKAADHVPPITQMAPGLRVLVSTPAILDAVKAQNVKHASLTQKDIDRLDLQWRAEVQASKRPLIDSVMNSSTSSVLKAIQTDSKGLITEIFVMDNRGLNVGQSEVTSDYWQGDEAKFKRSFDISPTAVFVDKIEQDESTQEFQSQLSMTLVDPADGKSIGAVTIGISIEHLKQ